MKAAKTSELLAPFYKHTPRDVMSQKTAQVNLWTLLAFPSSQRLHRNCIHFITQNLRV